MKKVLSLILTICIVFSLTACNDTKNQENQLLPEKTAMATEEPAQPEAVSETTPKNDTVPGDMLIVSFIDVGQGDCEFIELPNGKTMLIDAGNEKNSADISRYIKDKGHNTLDFVIATHPHSDHIGGMPEVLGDFQIGKMYMPKKEHTTKTFERLLDTIESNNIELHIAKAGVNILNESNLKIDILAPVSSSYSDLNNYSAVIKIDYGATSFLFVGDAEKPVENELLNSAVNPVSDVLKVGHHGSNSSSTITFLKAVSPKYAIISVGRGNRYGHPCAETLDRLNELGINIYRTDESGTIVVFSDGVNITVDKNFAQ